MCCNTSPMATRLSKAALELRRRLRLNQKRLAQEIGVTDQAISNWVCGRARPELEAIEALERVLGIPMRDWIEPAAESETSMVAEEEAHAQTG